MYGVNKNLTKTGSQVFDYASLTGAKRQKYYKAEVTRCGKW